MSTATAPAPETALPITFQPFAALDGQDDMTDIIAEHTRSAETAKTDPEIPVEEFSLAGLKKKAEAAERAAENHDKPEAEAVKPAAAKVEITDKTEDAELDKHIEENTKGVPKLARDAFKQKTYELREHKRTAAAAKAEAETLRVEMAKLKETAPDSNATLAVQKKLDELQAKLVEKETLLAGTNVRETEQFKTEIALPMAKITEEFKSFAETYDIAPEDMIGLTQLRGRALDSKIEELTLDMPKRGIQKLNDLVDRHAALAEKESSVMADAKKSYDNFMAAKRDEHNAALAKRAGERAEALPKVWEETIVKNAPFLKEVEGDTEWNERLKGTRAFVDAADAEWFSKQPTAVQVELTARAGAYPLLAHKLATMQAENVKLRARLGERKEATPGASSNGTRGAAEVKAEEPANGNWNPFRKT